MENNRLFLYINRLNSILFLLILISTLAFLAYAFAELNRQPNERAVEIEPPGEPSGKREVIELSEVEAVYGHDYQTIMAYSRNDGLLGSGGYSRTVRNLLFLDPQGSNPRWLMATNDQVITELNQLWHEDANHDYVTDYHYFYIVSTDSNGDGRLSDEDRIDVYISSPSGTEVSLLARGLERVINHQYDEGRRTLSLLAQVGSTIVYRTYSLESRKLLSEKLVTHVG